MGLVDTLKTKNGYAAVPYNLDMRLFWYRKDLLEKAGTTPPTIALTVSCQLSDTALQGLLYALETAPPTLLLDQLSIDAAAPGTGDLAPGSSAGTLKISMVLSAYWNGVGKS